MAHSCPKHVEKNSKHIKKICAPNWFCLQGYERKRGQQNIKCQSHLSVSFRRMSYNGGITRFFFCCPGLVITMAAPKPNYALKKISLIFKFIFIWPNNLKCFESTKSDFVIFNTNFGAHFAASLPGPTTPPPPRTTPLILISC